MERLISVDHNLTTFFRTDDKFAGSGDDLSLMIDTSFHTHGPDDVQSRYYPLDVISPIQSESSLLVGQDRPVSNLFALVLECELRDPLDRWLSVVGPTGVGKSSAIAAVSASLGYPCISVDLSTCGGAGRWLEQVIEHAPTETHRAVIHIQGLDAAAPARLDELGGTLDSRSTVSVLRQGTRQSVHLDQFVWVIELGSLQAGTKSHDPHVSTIALPDSVTRRLRRYVRFEKLQAEELYTIVSTGMLPAMGEITDWLLARGIEATFTELFLRDLAHEVAASEPYIGVRGLTEVLRKTAVGIAMQHLDRGARP